MPGRDGTGPSGNGRNGMKHNDINPDVRKRMTGHRFGRMIDAPGFRRFGCRYDLDTKTNIDTVDEKEALKANAAYLEVKLKEINERIETLS